MDNFLDNGTVLPFGLLSDTQDSSIAGFNKTYRNTSLRMGIVVKTYIVSDPNNLSKLTTEYDVLVFEQNEDRGSSVITYRNCISSEGLGSIADFFEKTLRNRTGQASKATLINTSDQDGAVVLIQCLDAMSEKAIIIGAVTHPDRKTNLINAGPLLVGEFNGVRVNVNNDGSLALIFKGATDNRGAVLDSSQGNTTIQIATDGSFQVDHKNTTFRLDKSGVTSLTTTSDINVTTSAGNVNLVVSQGNVNATITQGNVTVTALKDILVQCQGTATIEGKLIKLGISAIEAVIKGNTFQKIFDTHTHEGNLGFSTSAPLQSMIPSLSKKVVTE